MIHEVQSSILARPNHRWLIVSSATFYALFAVSMSSGAAYALFALGYSLVYSVLGLMNMAHGDVMMAATFMSLLVWETSKSLPLTILGGLAAGAAIGAAVDQVAYRPLRFTGDTIAPLVTGLGAAYIIRNLISSTFGSTVRPYPKLVNLAQVNVGTVVLPVGAAVVIVLALVVAYGIHLLLSGTRAGWVVRAVSQDITAARLVGLPVGTTLLATYAVSGIAAAFGGILYASSAAALHQSMGWNATTVAFTAAVLGGLGSVSRAVIGGVALGFADTFVAYLLPTAYEQAVSFGLLFVVILLRPVVDRRPLAVARA